MSLNFNPQVMRGALAVLGSALFLVIAPGIVVILVPWWISRWIVQESVLRIPFIRALGVLLILGGLPVLLGSFAGFALQGLGTPAPVFPTRHLVMKGFYRYVRNPMYLAVVLLIFGQALMLGNGVLFGYGVLVWLACHVFVLAYEEPTLRTTFGAEYDAFCANVPRWRPRTSPWRPNRE
ncbi:MAG TPA: isoprenylcysteine carboxylmethyltransferase family protein [Chthoniobacterales bacterium]|nr:isoprenylcysteine carboxylmethyltransferase family protein [Chthoniobacterales bacterium]